MQFHRRRKSTNAGEGHPAMNNFFGTVGSPIKMSTFDRHMEKRDRDRAERRPKGDEKKPAGGGAKPTAGAGAGEGNGGHGHHGGRRHHRRNSLELPRRRNSLETPAAAAAATPAPTPAPPPAPIDTTMSVNEDAATLDVKQKLILHKEIQRQQRQQREQARGTTPQPAPTPKNDILSVHDSSDDSEDDGAENVATVRNKGRERRRSTEFIGQPVEPVQQLKLDGARKAKIPHFMSAWFNADGNDKGDQNKDPNKGNAPAIAAAPAAPPAPPVVVKEEEKPVEKLPPQNTNPKLSGMTGRGYSQNISFAEIALGRMIGEGAFGKVYEGKWRGKAVAVKVLVCQDLRSDILHEFQSEVEIMSVLRHPNICRLLGACMDPPHRALVVELMQRGSLWGVLRTHRKTLDMDQRTRFIYDTAKGMAYLHHFERPILHRDLKSPNLLVDKNYNIKLSDFGLARVKAHVQTMTGNCGTVQWMAPEVLGNQKYTEKADVFSFGIVIWEIMTGECPYDGMSQIQAALGVLNRNLRPNMPRDCPPFFSRLMKACWNRQPELRPSFPHIVSAFRTYQSSLSDSRASGSSAAAHS